MLEEIEVVEGAVGVEGKKLGPLIAIGRGYRRGDDAEVFAGVVGADVEDAFFFRARGAMLGVVLLVVDARGKKAEVAGGVCGLEEAVLVGDVGAGLDHEVLSVAGLADADVEALVRLMEDHGIVGGLCADGVAEEVIVALRGLVFGGVEERLRVGGPDDGADAEGGVGQVLHGAEVANVEGVLAIAGLVGGVGEEVAIGRDGEGAEGHEGFALGELVDVEDDLLGLRRGSHCEGTSTGPWARRREWMAYWLPSTVRVM